MMDKPTLTPFAKHCYDLFMQGLTAYQIQLRTKVRMDCIMDARNEILRKGYTLPKLATPSTELPDDIETTRKVMKAMSEKEKKNVKTLTDEERQQIIEECGAGMSQKECAEKHGVTPATVCNILKKHRQSLAKQANPDHVPEPAEESEKDTAPDPEDELAGTPAPVIAAVRGRIHEIDKYIVETERILAEAREERHELTAWLEVRYHGRP